MTLGSIPGMSVGDHAKTSVFFDRTYLNSIFSNGCRFEPIQRVRSGWRGSTPNDSRSSSVLLSGYSGSMGKLESRIPPNFDCY